MTSADFTCRSFVPYSARSSISRARYLLSPDFVQRTRGSSGTGQKDTGLKECASVTY
jgi:hypothetical protein